ncbi:LysE family translocator [Aestuariispira insulae]|uniref:Threonine/homoserine/homoserine lactone efflux protein n=1 Tax=Aestuariispira insulae TaxID=1461337 RepID=A0A3D9HXJ8_9PROT|nr:LysE family translocator [Aestuariispira insulae]RED53626.1 threonine/homoserine/homoserine lactone efflux protein [Aestuariispira insulae]
MPVESWLLFVVITLVPVVSPGPAIMLAISNALRFGTKAALISGAGNATGVFLLGYAVTSGLGALMATSAIAFTVVKLIGAAYLLYLGIKVLRDRSAFRIEDNPVAARNSGIRLFGTALIVSLTNPKAVFLIAALFPQFINTQASVFLQISILSATFAGLCFLNHAFLAVFGGRMRRYLQSEKIMNRVRRGLGGTFIAFGAALAGFTR